MGKKKKQKKRSLLNIDLQIGIFDIIPSKQQAFHDGKHNKQKMKEEREKEKIFKKKLLDALDEEIKDSDKFPTKNDIFLFVQQYFVSQKEHDRRDVDNIAKTVLDSLKGKIYDDDSQVKVLLISKKKDQKIPQNFAYIAIKELKVDEDIDTLKVSGIDRSIQLFNETKKSPA